MKKILTFFLFYAPVVAHANGAATVTTLSPVDSQISAGSYTIALGETDDPKAPRTWEGPIEITTRGGSHCVVNDEVSLIEKPLALVGGHYLYVPTYSGSEGALYVVDADTCAVAWKSKNYVGKIHFSGDWVVIPGQPRMKIGLRGVPTPAIGE
ncbi:hypothetical protein AA23498_1872 [Acetobacter nitrogenifigens DSM 23921 = NBRC 105050]|uniref:Lipoprotein n=1 Tax=Acetobacter nitrogenifigens DSM 23921 = NBRC 105050 TaxID=1120919 RepID=A0A511XCL9_9PROT|nr:hypothetical protein [Acetobacter nitrogenifigens]GBQ93917.1 hypothetical protein AA23498_1872 [Acetobacter nitrogenifigens DSM 23921 = NBRC 105050]GEN60621.1 hypothetical protein ANI02nite_25050 [Acetobacter nitrogenifigens DSM 23921 = NBRC 105050]